MAIEDLVYVDATGYHSPDFPETLERMKDLYKPIYGVDVNLEDDTQDGQWLSTLSSALFDNIQVNANVYSSYSPATAQSDALTRSVKINGIARKTPTFSQVDLTIVGQFGTVITDGIAEDVLSQKWLLSSPVNIPASGTIVVTATAQDIGAVSALAGTVTKIDTPTNGWQSVNNLNDASQGQPVETDAELRLRQSVSTMIPNLTVMDGIVGAIETIVGVISVVALANDTNLTDLNGLPPKSISLVVEGGDSQEIADAIAKKKGNGTGTFGTTSEITVDSRGVSNTINFFRPTSIPIQVEVNLVALTGYLTTTADDIKQAVSDYINSLGIGAIPLSAIVNSKLCVPANLSNSPEGETFNLTNVLSAKIPGPLTINDIPVAFFELPTSDVADIAVNAS